MHSLPFLLTLTRTLHLQKPKTAFEGEIFCQILLTWTESKLRPGMISTMAKDAWCDEPLCATKKSRLKEFGSHYYMCLCIGEIK